jgi:hypothetical protein
MNKNIISLGLAGILSLSPTCSVAVETPKERHENSSIDSKLVWLYNSPDFKKDELPPCPNPYIIPDKEKTLKLKSLERKGIKVDACITDYFLYVKTSTNTNQCIIIGKVYFNTTKENSIRLIPYDMRTYSYDKAKDLMIFSD